MIGKWEELGPLWRKDGLAYLNRRAREAEKAHASQVNKDFIYAKTIALSARAWRAAAAAFKATWDGEDPNGWVSVDVRMPAEDEEVTVWNDTSCRWDAVWDGESWVSDFTEIHGVTHWRIPTPGPQEDPTND